MTLDLTKIVGQVELIATKLEAGDEDRQQRLEIALNVIKSPPLDLPVLRQKIERSRTTWLVAGVEEELGRKLAAVPRPPDVTVLATDGSSIDVDRHRSARFFVINIGTVRLDYGNAPDAVLNSTPFLYVQDEDLVLRSPDGRQEQLIQGPILSVKRGLEECRCLTRMVQEVGGKNPVLALMDGSLILWGLAGKDTPDFVVEAMVENGLVKYLEELEQESRKRRFVVASYISFPRNTEVVNVIRLTLCPHEPADCDRYCSGKSGETSCGKVGELLDRELFDRLLAPGERSAVFYSRSSIVTGHYGEQTVYFFYFKVDDEVARVEIPKWVAKNDELLSLAHSVLLDQCRRGFGYPVALSEAHERAVVTGADREQFWDLVDRVLAGRGKSLAKSAKASSKETRWV